MSAQWEPAGYESHSEGYRPKPGGGAGGALGCCSARPAAATSRRRPAGASARTIERHSSKAAAEPRTPPKEPRTPPKESRPPRSPPKSPEPIHVGDDVTLAPSGRVRLYIPVPADLQLRREVASAGGGGAPERGWAREGSGGLCPGEGGRVLAVSSERPAGGGSPRGSAQRLRVENQHGQVCWYEGRQLVRVAPGRSLSAPLHSPPAGSPSRQRSLRPPEPEPEPEPAAAAPTSAERRAASEAEVESLGAFKRQLAEQGWLDLPETAAMLRAFGGEDKCLLRFLRAYNCDDLPRSFEQFTDAVEFRRDKNVNAMDEPQRLVDSDPELKSFWPGAYPGFTAASPVQFFKVSHARPKEFLERFDEPRLEKFYLAWMERSLELQREMTEKRRAEGDADFVCEGTLEIYDAGGLAWSQMHVGGLKLLAKTLGLGTANYPENLHRAFIINAPRFLAVGWKVISPVLNRRTQEKISINAGYVLQVCSAGALCKSIC